MSVFDENIHPESHIDPSGDGDRNIDLLVDGELSEADRRTLLLQLEHEPNGWRRCALAFLEAQCWKTELGRVVPPATAATASVAPAAPALPLETVGRPQTWRRYTATALTIAASFLLAVVVVHGWPSGPHSGATLEKTVENTPAVKTADDWKMVDLNVANSSGGQPQAIKVAAQRRDTLDRDLLDRTPGAISPELQQAFEQSGHRVVQQREIIPIQMKDGQLFVVPVDHVEIHYVGRPAL